MPHHLPNEQEWIKLVLLLADTNRWLDELSGRVMCALPACKALQKGNYYLGCTALAHILERHYHGILRHPGTGKFTIAIPAIAECIRMGASVMPLPIPGHKNYHRSFGMEQVVGIDKHGSPTCMVTVITDDKGNIITAFLGTL